MGNMLPLVRTSGLVVVIFLILALLSRMSAQEVQLDVTVQHGLRQYVSKSQELQQQAGDSTHPVHRLVHLTQALNYLDAAFTLSNPKNCETVTKCKVSDLYTQLSQQQETVALQLLHMQQQHQHQQQQHQQPQHQQQQQQQHQQQQPPLNFASHRYVHE
jgi:hypothetical protein